MSFLNLIGFSGDIHSMEISCMPVSLPGLELIKLMTS